MSINRHELPDSRDIYTSDDLSPEDLRVLYLASLTDADREGAALTEDDVFDWRDNIGDDTVAVHRGEEDQIDGLIVYNETDQRVWVPYLATMPHARGGGVGRALIAYVKSQAGNRPIRGQATPTSQTYYEHLGMYVDSDRKIDT